MYSVLHNLRLDGLGIAVFSQCVVRSRVAIRAQSYAAHTFVCELGWITGDIHNFISTCNLVGSAELPPPKFFNPLRAQSLFESLRATSIVFDVRPIRKVHRTQRVSISWRFLCKNIPRDKSRRGAVPQYQISSVSVALSLIIITSNFGVGTEPAQLIHFVIWTHWIRKKCQN